MALLMRGGIPGTASGRILKWLTTVAVWLLLSGGLRAASVEEYHLKAAFLYNFAQFVSWPPEAFPDRASPFVIGVLGPDPFGGALDDIVAGEVLDGRPFVIRRYRTPEEIDACQILFVAGRLPPPMAAALNPLARRQILTVGEGEGFLESGGIVQFRMQNKRVRVRINLPQAEVAALVISSKLLRAAEVVGGPVSLE